MNYLTVCIIPLAIFCAGISYISIKYRNELNSIKDEYEDDEKDTCENQYLNYIDFKSKTSDFSDYDIV
jgi:hypothetical protein